MSSHLEASPRVKRRPDSGAASSLGQPSTRPAAQLVRWSTFAVEPEHHSARHQPEGRVQELLEKVRRQRWRRSRLAGRVSEQSDALVSWRRAGPAVPSAAAVDRAGAARGLLAEQYSACRERAARRAAGSDSGLTWLQITLTLLVEADQDTGLARAGASQLQHWIWVSCFLVLAAGLRPWCSSSTGTGAPTWCQVLHPIAGRPGPWRGDRLGRRTMDLSASGHALCT